MKEEKECLNCGKKFIPTCHITRQKFCSDTCRIEWWKEYHKAHPPEEMPAEECAFCGAALTGKQRGQTYCSRFCYLLAMDQTHVEETCEWCGEKFTDTSGQGRRYCSRSCATAARFTPQARRGSRRINQAEPEEWLEKLTEAARASRAGKRGKRVRLVCGITSMYTGLDGLLAIIRYHLKLDPYDGSVYVFRDSVGSMLKYIEWDGQSFLQGKRRAQSGIYPWPKGEPGRVVEVNKKEFTYLLSKSIVPFKKEKCCDT